MMKKVPPFVPNSPDDVHCTAAVYRMVIARYFGEDIPYTEMDGIGKAVPGKGMWNVPFDIYLAKRGLTVRNIEHTDFKALYTEKEAYLTRAFGEKNADYYIRHSNVMEIIPDIPEFLRLVTHESRKATVAEILTHLTNGALIAAEVNAGALNSTDTFSLHMVLLYDTDGKSITLHDPGLPPVRARTVSLAEFTSCFAYPGAGCGIDIFTASP